MVSRAYIALLAESVVLQLYSYREIYQDVLKTDVISSNAPWFQPEIELYKQVWCCFVAFAIYCKCKL
jgi:hypothetical protein